MNKIVSLGAALVLAVSASFVPTATSASAATPQCVFKPALPARVKINQDVVGLRTSLRASSTRCTQNFDVSTELVHSTDSFFMMWDGSGPDVEQVFAYEVVPGTYRTTGSDCDTYDNNFNQLSCTVARASTVIKFAARPRLTVTRSGSTVWFHAVATRYFDYTGFRPARGTLAIQRRSGTKWVTVHRGFASGKAGYTWSYNRVRKATYRVVSAETWVAFSAISPTVAR